MNHIKKLQLENASLKETLSVIKRYLHSNKFDSDIMVNKNDILLRIREGEDELTRIE